MLDFYFDHILKQKPCSGYAAESHESSSDAEINYRVSPVTSVVINTTAEEHVTERTVYCLLAVCAFPLLHTRRNVTSLVTEAPFIRGP